MCRSTEYCTKITQKVVDNLDNTRGHRRCTLYAGSAAAKLVKWLCQCYNSSRKKQKNKYALLGKEVPVLIVSERAMEKEGA